MLRLGPLIDFTKRTVSGWSWLSDIFLLYFRLNNTLVALFESFEMSFGIK